MISLKNLPLMAFFLFLVFYSFQKYTAVPQTSFNPDYTINVAIIVAFTAVLPWFITRIKMRFTSGLMQMLAILLAPVAISAIGFAVYYYVFIAPNFPDVPITAVLPRSLFPGMTISAILLLSLVTGRRAA